MATDLDVFLVQPVLIDRLAGHRRAEENDKHDNKGGSPVF